MRVHDNQLHIEKMFEGNKAMMKSYTGDLFITPKDACVVFSDSQNGTALGVHDQYRSEPCNHHDRQRLRVIFLGWTP